MRNLTKKNEETEYKNFIKGRNILVFVNNENKIIKSTEIYGHYAFINILENTLKDNCKVSQHYKTLVKKYGNRILAITSNYKIDIKNRYYTNWDFDNYNSCFSTLGFKTSKDLYNTYLNQGFNNFKIL